jgi:peptidyl-prolyl cis-trans isomerase SurA
MAVMALSFFINIPAARAAEVDRIVAVVNGEIITLRQLDSRVATMMKSGRVKGGSQTELRRGVLETLVEQELVNQAARARGVNITPSDVAQAIEAIKKENNLTNAQLSASLAASGTSMEAFREDLTVELMRNRIMGGQIASKIVVTDREVLAVLNGEGPPM